MELPCIEKNKRFSFITSSKSVPQTPLLNLCQKIWLLRNAFRQCIHPTVDFKPRCLHGTWLERRQGSQECPSTEALPLQVPDVQGTHTQWNSIPHQSSHSLKLLALNRQHKAEFKSKALPHNEILSHHKGAPQPTGNHCLAESIMISGILECRVDFNVNSYKETKCTINNHSINVSLNSFWYHHYEGKNDPIGHSTGRSKARFQMCRHVQDTWFSPAHSSWNVHSTEFTQLGPLNNQKESFDWDQIGMQSRRVGTKSHCHFHLQMQW